MSLLSHLQSLGLVTLRNRKAAVRKAWVTRRSNLVGKVFGRLTVVAKTKKGISKGGHKTNRWRCSCSCGNKTTVATSNLVAGSVISCGCALRGINSKRPLEWVYNKLVAGATKRNLEVKLSYKQFVCFSKTARCHYCDLLLRWTTAAHNLDRKDNNKGYSKRNCVTCCKLCNFTKADRFTYKQFVQIGKVIRSFRES